MALTPIERDLYNAIEAWQRSRAAAKNMPVQFTGQMPLRLAGSCLQASATEILAKDGYQRPNEDLDEVEEMDPVDFPLGETVIALAHQLGDTDSKFDAFIGPLESIVAQGRQVLVSPETRSPERLESIAYLEQRLADRFRVGVLHGGIKPRDRPEIMARFRAKDFDVMLASRVASEGDEVEEMDC